MSDFVDETIFVYIEGSDLLQGRYGIAANNIEAKDVGKTATSILIYT